MFTSKRVGCFLNQFSGYGDDPESKELKLVFYITPIEQSLAEEISPLLADRLFRVAPEGSEQPYEPAKEITKASFSNLSIQMQNIEFNELPEGGPSSTTIQGCAISNLRASRAFPDSPMFRLEFDVVLPMDKQTMRLVEKYYKATTHLTMEEIQRNIEYKADDAKAAETGNALQDAADSTDEADSKKGRRKRGPATANLTIN